MLINHGALFSHYCSCQLPGRVVQTMVLVHVFEQNAIGTCQYFVIWMGNTETQQVKQRHHLQWDDGLI